QEMRTMKVAWHGVFPAAVTHFRPDHSLDLDATLRHLDAMIAAGVHGMIMLGTVGENCSLEYPEKVDVLKATIRHVNRRVPVLTGVARRSPRVARRFAAGAGWTGVGGVLGVPGTLPSGGPSEREAGHPPPARSSR